MDFFIKKAKTEKDHKATTNTFVNINYQKKIELCLSPIKYKDEDSLIIFFHLVGVTFDECIKIESESKTGVITPEKCIAFVDSTQKFISIKNAREKMSKDLKIMIYLVQAQAYWLSIILRNGIVEDEEAGIGLKQTQLIPAVLTLDVYEYTMYDLKYAILNFSKRAKFEFWTPSHTKVLNSFKCRSYVIANSCYACDDENRLSIFDVPVFYKKEKSEYFMPEDEIDEEGQDEDLQKKTCKITVNEHYLGFFERFIFHLTLKSMIFHSFPWFDGENQFRPPSEITLRLVKAIYIKAIDTDIAKSIDSIVCKQVTGWLCTNLERQNFMDGKILEDGSNTKKVLESNNPEALTPKMIEDISRGNGFVREFTKKLEVTKIENLVNVNREDAVNSQIFLVIFEVWVSSFIEKIEFSMKDFILDYEELVYPFEKNKKITTANYPLLFRIPHGWGVWDYISNKILVYTSIIEALIVWTLSMEDSRDKKAMDIWKVGLCDAKDFLLKGTEWETKVDIRTENEIPFYEKKTLLHPLE